MRDAGYWTIGVASNPLLYRPYGYSRGFEDWVELEGIWYGKNKPERFTKFTLPPQAYRRTGDLVNEAAKGALDRRPNDRFFLYVHYMDAHDYGHADVPYAKGVSDADYYVGRLLEHLEKSGPQVDEDRPVALAVLKTLPRPFAERDPVHLAHDAKRQSLCWSHDSRASLAL